MSVELIKHRSSLSNDLRFNKSYYLDKKDSISKKISIKSIFKPFLSDEDIEKRKNNDKYYKKHINEFLHKFKDKQKEIRKLYNINNTVFNQIIKYKPTQAFFQFKKEMKEIFFGRNSQISKKFGFFEKILKRKSVSDFDLNKKIFTGNLDFLDIEEDLKLKKINNIKKNYLMHSTNFIIGKKPSLISLHKESITSPKIIKYQSKIKKSNSNKEILSENDSNSNINNYKKDSLTLNPSNTFSSFFNKYMLSTIKKNSSKKYIKIKKLISSRNSRNINNINIKSKTTNFTSLDNNIYSNVISKSNDSVLSRNEIKQKKKEIVSQIQETERPISKIKNQLYKIIDRANKIKNKDLRDKNVEKIRKDIEIITGYKVKFINKPKTKTFLLESLKDELKIKKIKDITKVSDKLTKMTDEDALKYAEGYKINDKGLKKFLLPKPKEYTKYNYNMIIRDNCLLNYEKIGKMAVSLEKLKNKIDFNNN